MDCQRCGSSHADGRPHVCGPSDFTGTYLYPPREPVPCVEGKLANRERWCVTGGDKVRLTFGYGLFSSHEMSREDAVAVGNALIEMAGL